MTWQSVSRASRARFVAVAAVIVVASAFGTRGRALLDNHSRLTVEMLMEDVGGGAVDVTTDPVETTDDACGPARECVEAYSTEEASYYRFASREQATDYAASLEDGFLIHYIVMDFAGKDTAS